MIDWKAITLGELIDIKHGYAFKGEYFSDVPNGNVVLTPGNFEIGGGFKNTKSKCYTGPIPSDYVLKGDDVVVTMTDLSKDGDTLGYSARIPKDVSDRYLHNQRIGLVQLRSNEADLGFIYWLMRWRDYQLFIVNTATGSTVRHTSPKKIQSFSFLLPPIEEQKEMVGVLGSLDDKIELLREENKTLEAIAQAIFKEWFVQDDNLQKVVLDSLVQFNPKESVSLKSEHLFFEMKCLSENAIAISEGTKRTVKSATSFRENDTLMAKITPCLENGKTGFVFDLKGDDVARGSTEFIVMRATRKSNPYFVYCLARSENFRDHAIKSMTGTSGRQRVQVELLKSYQARFSEETMENFGNICEPMFAKIKVNISQIQTLSILRDTLLPKLMKGDIRII